MTRAEGGGLFANVETGEHDVGQLPFTLQHPPRGLDSGFAKACPSSENDTQKTYRSVRRRLELFQKQCLKDVAWDATEHLSFGQVKRAQEPFKRIFKLLDKLYQYEGLIEVPSRCDGFFIVLSEFQRGKGEELQTYIIRRRDLLVDIPPLVSGWHLLTRAVSPRWTHGPMFRSSQSALVILTMRKWVVR